MRAFLVTLMCGLWLSQGIAQAQEASDQCEAAFELHQSMNLTMSFNGVEQLQHINVAYDIYVRSVPVPDAFAERKIKEGLVAYVFLVDSPLIESTLNESDTDGRRFLGRARQPYPNPFLIVADSSGALVQLQSSANDISVLKAYRSFYDAFQFSWLPNSYQYQNGIGHYEASVVGVNLEPTSQYIEAVLRKNKGYDNTESAMAVQLLESEMRYYQKEGTQGCFFDKAEGTDVFSQTLNADTYVDIDARIALVKKNKPDSQLPALLLSLSNDVSLWPEFDSAQKPSTQDVKQKAPALLLELSTLVNDKEAFYLRLKDDVTLLPYLHEYLQTNPLNNDLSKRLYWALDRLNSVESVALLVEQSIGANSDRDRYRSALALSSTNAPISDFQLSALKHHVLADSAYVGYSESHLVYVRLLGAVARNRNQYHPEQAESLRDYLYSQVGMNSPELNKAIIDSVGNLGEAIDEDGYALLLSEAQYGLPGMRTSAIDALSRLALGTVIWQQIPQAYRSEKALPIRQRWLALMSNASPDNMEIKLQLRQALKNDNLRVTALNSMETIDYKLSEDDVDVLKSYLKESQSPVVQRRLASLILRANRRNK
jgi:hypothetical protein